MPREHPITPPGSAAAPPVPWLLAPASFTPGDYDAACELIERLAEVAQEAYPEVPLEVLARLAQQAVRWIADGRAADAGLQLTNLCAEAGESENHLREHFGPRWQQAGELIVRALMRYRGPGVMWEVLKSVPAESRPSHRGLGRDHLPGKAAGIRVLGFAVGAPGRCLLPSSILNTRGTRDDLTSGRCEPTRIAEFERQCGMDIAGSIAEHVELLSAARDTVRARVSEGMKPAYRGLAEAIFSDVTIAEALPAGPSLSRGLWHGELAYPGDEPDTLEVLRSHVRRGVARCSPQTLEQAERDVPSSEWEQLEVVAGAFARRHALELDRREGRFWWVPGPDLLVDELIGRESVTSACWQPFGLAEDRGSAATLAALARHAMPRECVERARADCAWGLISASSIWSDAAMRTVLHVADAACVTAERDRRRVEMETLEGLSPSRGDGLL
jgi:hypothetical protein